MKKNKARYDIIIPLIAFFIISILSIYSASNISSSNSIVTKQVLWYLIGFGIIILTMNKRLKRITDFAFILYIIGNVLLFLLLIFGTEVNGSKCWFIIPGVGSFQPSEFMKLILILVNAKTFELHSKKYPVSTLGSDIRLFLIILVITLIPSVLTFMEPDTGMVMIYFLITFVMLFIYGIKKSIFFVLIALIIILAGSFLYFYFNFQDTFINVFGTSFFYRIDRLLDWSNKSGMQLTNALAAIKAAGAFGFGVGNTPIYIPESHTDFIFSVFSSNFGLIGTFILIGLIVLFDYGLLKYANETNDRMHKYIIIGFVTMILYQQIQNIGMNIGLLPITGITLPFISYGGSSLLSYMLGVALILNYDNKSIQNLVWYMLSLKENKKPFISERLFYSTWWRVWDLNPWMPPWKGGVLNHFTNAPVYKYKMVGLNGREPSTSRLSGVRSNQLSYKPIS